ncbi:MAG: acyltransferase [Clostridiales bacterium]|nr:acyltransferase [Clostridiales bacterium]
MEKRIEWLDIAKGFSILFIVLGHTSNGFLHWFCFSFNSAIFFILSGMTFCRIRNGTDELLCFDKRAVKEFLKNILGKLFFPYFVWGCISIIIYYFMEGVIVSHLQLEEAGNYAIIPNIIGLLYGNSETDFFEYYSPLWFIPCLISVQGIWFIILKIMYRLSGKKAWGLYYIVMAIFVLFGCTESILQWNLILPFEMESAIFMSFFFGIGLLLRSWGGQNRKIIHLHIVGKNGLWFVIWITIAVIGTYMNGHANARVDNFGNILLFIFNVLWISGGIIYISYAIQRWLLAEYIGKRTLAILVMHKYPIMFLKLFPFIQRELEKCNFIIEISVALITIMCCLAAEKIISRFVPQLYGI